MSQFYTDFVSKMDQDPLWAFSQLNHADLFGSPYTWHINKFNGQDLFQFIFVYSSLKTRILFCFFSKEMAAQTTSNMASSLSFPFSSKLYLQKHTSLQQLLPSHIYFLVSYIFRLKLTINPKSSRAQKTQNFEFVCRWIKNLEQDKWIFVVK